VARVFGVCALKLVELLPHNKVGSHVGDQLFRSATSPGAHLQEARAAESRADFIHKLQMALKEMREARYWLNVARLGLLLKSEDVAGPCQEADELVAILSQSVLTAKSRMSGNLKPQSQHFKP